MFTISQSICPDTPYQTTFGYACQEDKSDICDKFYNNFVIIKLGQIGHSEIVDLSTFLNWLKVQLLSTLGR